MLRKTRKLTWPETNLYIEWNEKIEQSFLAKTPRTVLDSDSIQG